MTESERTILGIDPGIDETGYCVLSGEDFVEAGYVRTDPADPEPVRYAQIFHEVAALIGRHDVDEVAVEHFEAFYWNRGSGAAQRETVASAVFGGGGRRYEHDRQRPPDARSLYKLKGAQTAALLAAVLSGKAVALYQPREWRKTVGRRGKRGKASRNAVLATYGVEIRNDDVSDAVMIATHHARAGTQGCLGPFPSLGLPGLPPLP